MTKLRITLGSTAVDTSDADIPVVLRSPIFPTDAGKIPGSFIFNSTFPYTNDLKLEFKHAHRPARNGHPTFKYPFQLSFGVLHYAGTATITELSDAQIELSMPVDTGDLNTILKKYKLADLSLGGDTIIIPFYSDAVETNNWACVAYQPEYFDIEDFLEFNIINADIERSFNETASSYTAKSDQVAVVTFKCNVSSNITNGSSIRFKVNGVIREEVTFEDFLNTITVNLTLQANDIVTYTIFLLSLEEIPGNPETLHIINFVIDPGHEITFEPLDPRSIFDLNVNKFWPDVNYALFPFENPGFFGNLDDDMFMIDTLSIKELYSTKYPVLNYFVNGRFPIAMTKVIGGIHVFAAGNLFVPALFVPYITQQLLAFIGFSTDYNPFTDDTDLQKLVLFNLYAENNFVDKNFVKIKSSFNLADHVPDMTLGDFLRELCRFWGIVFQSNTITRKITFKWLQDIMDDTQPVDFSDDIASGLVLTPENYNGLSIKQTPGPASDTYMADNLKSLDGLSFKGSVLLWNDLPHDNNEINDCYLVTIWNAYYAWNYDTESGDLNWIFHSLNFFLEYRQEPDEDATGELFQMETQITPVMMNKGAYEDKNICAPGYGEPDLAWRRWLIPSTDQPGSFEGTLPDMQTDFNQSLLFYYGLKKDNHNNDYPFATNDAYDFSGNRIADLCLRLDGDYGIYKNKLQKFVEWRINNPGEFTFKKFISAKQLSELDFFKWYKILGVDYLLKEVRFSIRHDHISLSEIIAYRR